MENINEEENLEQVKASFSQKLLKEMLASGNISEEMYEIYQQKVTRLNEALGQSFSNHSKLASKCMNLRRNLINEKVKLESAHNSQKQNQLIVKELNLAYTKARDEQNIQKEKRNTLSEGFNQLENEKAILEMKIKTDRQRAEEAIKPEEEKYKKEIRGLDEQEKKLLKKIEEQEKLQENQKKQMQKSLEENEQIEKDLEKLESEVSKISDGPDRYERNLNAQIEHKNKYTIMLNDSNAIIEEREKKKKQQLEKIAELEKREEDKEAEIDREGKKNDDLHTQKSNKLHQNEKLKTQMADQLEKKEQYQMQIEEQISIIKRKSEQVNTTKKEIDQIKKAYKKSEHERNQIKNLIFEIQRSMSKIEKEKEEFKNQVDKFKYMTGRIAEEEMLLFHKHETLLGYRKDNEEHLEKLKKNIGQYELKLESLKKTEQQANSTVKNMQTIRETMARKASSALAEVRETREELKIKELLILDLTKKEQEIVSKLNSFKALYEEVKSARNKYVNLIQNSSQDLAELKERIKISQNELEILKNESSEKQRTLNRLFLTIQKHKYDRDKAKSELNRFEAKKKTLVERGNQQANEIQKLNMITLNLQNDMLDIRKRYEEACESRNHMGVQLIDRNDELCILYEKNNIQDNIIKNGEAEIKKTEDELRMIKIEIAEVARKIDVAKKNIPEVPKLADKVVNLKIELELEKKKENELSEKLEDPNNKDRWREFKGEDPDQEALEAKIQVLEERLNLKKETLLEKELILDEVTNLSENLRKQALEGRYSTLEVSTTVNELQARLKKITRKMMATISELSMFQANVIKLQQEKEDIQQYLQNVQERVEEELPPTDNAEILFLKKLRDRKRYQEQVEMKMEEKILRDNMNPFAINSTAVPRAEAYIDEMGLRRPYGIFRQFKASNLGANLRHYRKPQPRQIEIQKA